MKLSSFLLLGAGRGRGESGSVLLAFGSVIVWVIVDGIKDFLIVLLRGVTVFLSAKLIAGILILGLLVIGLLILGLLILGSSVISTSCLL